MQKVPGSNPSNSKFIFVYWDRTAFCSHHNLKYMLCMVLVNCKIFYVNWISKPCEDCHDSVVQWLVPIFFTYCIKAVNTRCVHSFADQKILSNKSYWKVPWQDNFTKIHMFFFLPFLYTILPLCLTLVEAGCSGKISGD